MKEREYLKFALFWYACVAFDLTLHEHSESD